MKGRSFPFFLRFLLSVIAILVGLTASAQTSFTVKVKLVDAKTSEPVSFATASLTVKGETTASKYVLTDADGAASLTKVKKGTYIFKAELMGYVTYQQELVIEKNLDLGVIKMDEDVKVLDAASVSAVGNPIVVKKDTIEYSASSFKTSDNDMLEELLKKLPGVEVEADGSITANGETITKSRTPQRPSGEQASSSGTASRSQAKSCPPRAYDDGLLPCTPGRRAPNRRTGSCGRKRTRAACASRRSAACRNPRAPCGQALQSQCIRHPIPSVSASRTACRSPRRFPA